MAGWGCFSTACSVYARFEDVGEEEEEEEVVENRRRIFHRRQTHLHVDSVFVYGLTAATKKKTIAKKTPAI